MDPISLNRLGILLNFAAGLLLAPQIIGEARLLRAEHSIENGLDGSSRIMSRWVKAQKMWSSGWYLAAPGWLIMVLGLSRASAQDLSWTVEVAIGYLVAAAPIGFLMVFATLLGHGLGDTLEMNGYLGPDERTPWEHRREWLGIAIYVTFSPVLVPLIDAETCSLLALRLVTRLGLKALSPTSDRLPAILVGLGALCFVAGTTSQLLALS